jgi:hypothetical protein
MNKIRPLAFEMDCRGLLFGNELYFDDGEGNWAGDGWPLPPIFGRTGLSGSPRPL